MVLALTGAAIAPAFVVAYVLADRLVDDSVRTETNTWIATAANLGGAAGAAVAGLTEHVSARASFAVGGGSLTLSLPILFLTRSRRNPGSPPMIPSLGRSRRRDGGTPDSVARCRWR